ncbi:carboxypeptidase-like regulatory domain-containing protein [Haloglomus litoreum]|uniref:carboxypeptidase-like regulatory domain-containing protein n=1 Tax=Haloglomus litoreum TaxID=3034026 RepID=UPI0023E8ED3F|nr:carboxypeptidase-like regulatory domain-containing protein [Haloglomus sp. DT116]
MNETHHTDDGGGIVEDKLRLAELAGHLGSWLAVVTTMVMVGAAAAREVNPVSAFVIEHASMETWAVGTPLLVFAGFTMLRYARARNEAPDDLLKTHHLGGLLASGLLADGLLNCYAVATAGLPETLRWSVIAGEAAAVGVLALVLIVRPDPRPLVSAGRDVTSRLSAVEARSVALALMVVTSMFVGAVSISLGPLPAADRASAAGTVVDDFEDGSISDWTKVINGQAFSASQNRAYEGSYSMLHDGSDNGGGARITKDLSSANPSSASAWVYYANYSSSTRTSAFKLRSSSGSVATRVEVKESDGSLFVDSTDTGFDIPQNEWVRWKYKNIDYNSDTYTVIILDADGNEIYNQTGVGFVNSVSVEQFAVLGGSGGYQYWDFFAVDGAAVGQPVSGTISTADGSGINGGTVELLDSSDSVISTTTTNSSGYYQFDAVSDATDYQIRASASGYQNKTSDSFDVAGAPRTVDLKLFESGTFVREFQLDEAAKQTYPPSLSRLEVYRFDRAIEFPLPGGTTFKAGPGTWKEISDKDINAYGKASVRLEDGTPYRVEVVATSGDRSTRWGSLGWRANKSAPDPYLISVGDQDVTATPTATGTATSPTATPVATDGGTSGGGVSGPDYPGLNPPCDPFDRDNDGNLQECPDGDETDGPGSTVTYTASDGFGPRIAGECVLTDGTTGLLIEYWDPSYETTSLTFNVSHENSSYSGDRQFDTAAGYATWCVADAVTGNASDAADGALTGNYTANGTTFNYTESLQQSSLLGGPLGGGGGSGAGGATPGQQVVGIGLSAGVGYLLVRRFTDFRISSALSGAVSRARSLVGGGS